MRFPSLGVLINEASRTVRAYPLVLVFATAAAVAALGLVESSNNPTLIRLLLSAQLGIPLFFATTIFGGRFSPLTRRLIEAMGVVLLAAYFISLTPRMSPITVARFIQFNVGCHLLAAFLPFVRTSGVGGFWQYNRTLFLRFLLSAIYSGVFFAGLAIALAALDKLFGLPVEDEAYLRMWIVIAFVFNTWFFVGGVSSDTAQYRDVRDYPTGLKVFTQYVLVPLIIVYLLILTAYLGKVLLTRSWPSGWIGYLVSSVAAAGILAMLLVHPIKDSEGNGWIRTFSRWFYVFILPSIGMLFVAVFKRIAQYGITENRYFLMVLTFWLAGTAVYFIVSRSKSIKTIPTTLCFLAFLTAYGPWGAYSVSEVSQVRRLRGLLEKNDLMSNGHAVATTGEVSFDDRKEASAILYYLADVHGFDSIRDWFDPPLADADTLNAGEEPYRRHAVAAAKTAMSRLDLEYVEQWASVDQARFNIGSMPYPQGHAIAGYQYHYRFHRRPPAAGGTIMGDGEYTLSYEKDAHAIALRRGDETVLAASLDPVFDNLAAGRLSPMDDGAKSDLLRIEAEKNGYRLLVYFNQLSGIRKGDTYDVQYFDADCFVAMP